MSGNPVHKIVAGVQQLKRRLEVVRQIAENNAPRLDMSDLSEVEVLFLQQQERQEDLQAAERARAYALAWVQPLWSALVELPQLEEEPPAPAPGPPAPAPMPPAPPPGTPTPYPGAEPPPPPAPAPGPDSVMPPPAPPPGPPPVLAVPLDPAAPMPEPAPAPPSPPLEPAPAPPADPMTPPEGGTP